MAGPLITTASSLQCPHGGSIGIVSANARVKAEAALALATDTFTVSGCPFQIPIGTGSVPHPCVRVQWVQVNAHVTVNGAPTLAQDSQGLCLAADQVPQGLAAIIQASARTSGS